MELVYGDGHLSLAWPDGEEHDGWEWSPRLATTVEALLTGRNEQTIHVRLGRVFAVDMAVWDATGQRHELRRRWFPRRALLAIVPFPPASQLRRSLSFDRPVGLVPT